MDRSQKAVKRQLTALALCYSVGSVVPGWWMRLITDLKYHHAVLYPQKEHWTQLQTKWPDLKLPCTQGKLNSVADKWPRSFFHLQKWVHSWRCMILEISEFSWVLQLACLCRINPKPNGYWQEAHQIWGRWKAWNKQRSEGPEGASAGRRRWSEDAWRRKEQ